MIVKEMSYFSKIYSLSVAARSHMLLLDLYKSGKLRDTGYAHRAFPVDVWSCMVGCRVRYLSRNWWTSVEWNYPYVLLFLLLPKFHLYWLKNVISCGFIYYEMSCVRVPLFLRLFCFPKLCRYCWKRVSSDTGYVWHACCGPQAQCMLILQTLVSLYHLYQLQSQCMMFPWSPKPTTCVGRKRIGLINPGSLAWKIAMVWTGNCQKDWFTLGPSVNIKSR